jgi:large subunit ribosomal protein L30
MEERKMLVIIRIVGDVGIKSTVRETFNRLRLRRKYACVLMEKTPENLGMLKKVKDFVAYGEISEEMHKKLIEKRGRKDVEGKLKPFFRLHPPRGGIESKKHFGVGKGVLGDQKEHINKLIERML